MDANRFDAISRRLATRRSRRGLLHLGAVSVAAVGATGLASVARAQGTPSAAGGGVAANNATLFVQTAASGTFVPTSGTPVSDAAARGTPVATHHGAYRLTLAGHGGETIAFADRPRRDFAAVATSQFLTQAGMFTPGNPPNAALVVGTAPNDEVVLLELSDPAYDPGTKALSYGADLLHTYPDAAGSALAPLAARAQATPVPTTFDQASLFLDDCPDADPLGCYDTSCNEVGDLGTRGMCWSWAAFRCQPCQGSWDGTARECDSKFPACDGQCTTDWWANCNSGP